MIGIDLGCGRRPVPGCIHVDFTKHSDCVDVVHDLNVRPWPFESGYADKIYAIDVLEHLVDFVPSLEECHRILKVGGQLYLQVPFAGNLMGIRDPTHRWHLTPNSLDYFIVGTDMEINYGFYSPMRWSVLSYQDMRDNLYWELQKCQG